MEVTATIIPRVFAPAKWDVVFFGSAPKLETFVGSGREEQRERELQV